MMTRARTRFGSPLEHARVHWVRPEVVVEVTYLTWTEGGLLRAVSYHGQREDKPARQVVRSVPAVDEARLRDPFQIALPLSAGAML